MNRKEFLTPDQVVDRWGGAIGRGTLANWRAKGRGPAFVKIGARVVYPIDALLAWEKENENGGDAPNVELAV